MVHFFHRLEALLNHVSVEGFSMEHWHLNLIGNNLIRDVFDILPAECGRDTDKSKSLSEVSELFSVFCVADWWRFLLISFSSYLLVGLGFRPDHVCIRKVGLGDSFSFSSSDSVMSYLKSSLLVLFALFLTSRFSSFGFLPLFILFSSFSACFAPSLITNCCMRRGSRIFSSGSQVEYLAGE